MRWDELDAESCSVARAISVIVDRWTMMILRDCFQRVRRFEEFEQRLGITRHILSDRLRKLVRLGVLERVPYQKRPPRHEYRLTQKGLDLHPVILALVAWGDTHMAGRRGAPFLLEHRCGHVFHAVATCSECGEAVAPRDVRMRLGPGAPRKAARLITKVQATG